MLLNQLSRLYEVKLPGAISPIGFFSLIKPLNYSVELPDFQAGFRKGRGTRGQIANSRWIIEKSKRVPEKHLFLLY